MPAYDVITYTNPLGQVVNFADAPYMLLSYDGFGIGEFALTTVAPPQGHGEYWYDTRMSAKVLTVEFQYMGEGVAEKQASRREIIKLLNPLLGPGTLRIDMVNGISREIKCVLGESLGLAGADMVGVGAYSAVVRFKSHGIPALVDPTINTFTLDFNATPGNFLFPWTFPRIFAQSGFASSPIIVNLGDIETPVRIQITGPALNPIFRNDTTGRVISLQGLTLTASQVLVVDTSPDAYVMQVDGADVWNYAVSADMWGLVAGENKLVFDVGGTSIATVGSVQWYTRELGR